jgi:uncharacterized protein (UPF0216 family)
MILLLMTIMCIFMGWFFALTPYLFDNQFTRVLPLQIIGVIWLTIGYILILYRGFSSRYWSMLDFPERDKIIAFNINKKNMYPERLRRSVIKDLLSTEDGNYYYRDKQDSALHSAGHEIRFIKDGVNHTIDKNELILVNELHRQGIKSIKDMDSYIFSRMLQLKEVKKDKDGVDHEIYLLTGTESPPEFIDIEKNPVHKHYYDAIAESWGFALADGEVLNVALLNNMQRELAREDDMASIIRYVQSIEAAKALRIKRNIKSNMLLYIIIVIIGILLVVGIAAFFMMGGKIPGISIPGTS